MATSQDIMAFLMAEKEERSKEKEDDKALRIKERKEDIEQIKVMIKTSVKEEVQAAVEPYKEKLELQDKETKELRKETTELRERFEEVLSEVKSLKEFRAGNQFPQLPVPSDLGRLDMYRSSQAQASHVINNQPRDPEETKKVQELCASARKVIGFTPIEPRMLEMQIRSYGAKDHIEAMEMEVKSYMKCEMKMYPTEIEKLDIVKVFAPPGQIDWNTLYVERGSEYQVAKVFKHTKYMMKSDHRVLHWFPSQMKERREAIEKIAFDIREAGRADKVRTRLRVGREDLELSTKLSGGKWRRESLPFDLPPIDFTYSPSPAPSSSPPPGRPGLVSTTTMDRKRQKSPSSDEDEGLKKHRGEISDISQVDRVTDNPEQHSMQDIPERKEESAGLGDIGKFTGLEAYSPLTPAKAKSIPDLSIIVNLPVFHTSTRTGKKGRD